MSEASYYETMYILRPDIPEEEVDSHLKKYSEILEKSGTDVLDSQMRGKRRLAYTIAKHKEGIYVQLSHKGDGQQVATLERAMRLSEDVIRYLTVKQYGPLPTPKSSSKDDESEKSEIDKEEVKPSESKIETPANDDKKEEPKE
tara:strand:+ start:390 stop:821 length:432 start_codon:yes stop_codon:yes gene_type:complete